MSDSKWLTQVKRGLLELCILNLVARDVRYGYEIVKRLTEAHGLVITVGTIYPLLSRLKREGLLHSTLTESDKGPARRTYTLSPEGGRHLRAINESWREIAEAVEQLICPDTTENGKGTHDKA